MNITSWISYVTNKLRQSSNHSRTLSPKNFPWFMFIISAWCIISSWSYNKKKEKGRVMPFSTWLVISKLDQISMSSEGYIMSFITRSFVVTCSERAMIRINSVDAYSSTLNSPSAHQKPYFPSVRKLCLLVLDHQVGLKCFVVWSVVFSYFFLMVELENYKLKTIDIKCCT